tara:strand:+ start:2260 stop:3225 length:966 start_codon:yes stop_codon:yes gene_type:complete
MSVNPFVGAIQDAVPSYEEQKAKAVNTANINYEDAIAKQWAPLPRILSTKGRYIKGALSNIGPGVNYDSLYGFAKKNLPQDVMPDTEKIAQDAQALSDKRQMDLTAMLQQLQAAGYSNKKINKIVAEDAPHLLNPLMEVGMQPDTGGRGFGIVNAVTAAGGAAGYQYVRGLMKYMPSKTELVKGLGAEGYRAVGYNRHGNINTGYAAPKGGNYGSLKELTVEEMTDKKGPYKYTKKKANQIIKNRKTGSKALQWAGSKKGAIGRNVVKAMIKAGKLGKLGSTAAAAGSGGLLSLPSLLSFGAFSALTWGGEKMLDNLYEGE